MITIFPDRFIIEVESNDPVKYASYLKLALLDAIEHITTDVNLSHVDYDWLGMSNIIMLLKEMEYQADEIESALLKPDGKPGRPNGFSGYVCNDLLSQASERANAIEKLVKTQQERIEMLESQLKALKGEHAITAPDFIEADKG